MTNNSEKWNFGRVLSRYQAICSGVICISFFLPWMRVGFFNLSLINIVSRMSERAGFGRQIGLELPGSGTTKLLMLGIGAIIILSLRVVWLAGHSNTRLEKESLGIGIAAMFISYWGRNNAHQFALLDGIGFTETLLGLWICAGAGGFLVLRSFVVSGVRIPVSKGNTTVTEIASSMPDYTSSVVSHVTPAVKKVPMISRPSVDVGAWGKHLQALTADIQKFLRANGLRSFVLGIGSGAIVYSEPQALIGLVVLTAALVGFRVHKDHAPSEQATAPNEPAHSEHDHSAHP